MGDFGDLFSKSWREYKSSFGLFFKIFLLFSLIPSVVLLFLNIFAVISIPEMISDPGMLLSTSIPLVVLLMSVGLIVGFLSLVMYILSLLKYGWSKRLKISLSSSVSGS